MALWLETNGSDRGLYARRFDGSNWLSFDGSATGFGAGGSTTVGLDYQVAARGNDIAVAWTQSTGDDAVVVVREYSARGGAQAWRTLNVADGGADPGDQRIATSPTVAYGSDGTLFLAWSEENRGNSYISQVYARHLASSSQTWSDAGTQTGALGVSNAQFGAISARLAASASGAVHLTWLDVKPGSDGGYEAAMFATRWTGSGFSAEFAGDVAGTGVGKLPTVVSDYQLVADPLGRPFAAYFDGDVAHPGIFVRGNTFSASRVFVADASASVQSILDNNMLVAGDVLYVMPGTVVGATTVGAGDTGFLLLGGSGATIGGALTLDGTSGVTVENLTVTGPAVVSVSQNVTVRDNVFLSGLVVDRGSSVDVIENRMLSSGVGLAVQSGADPQTYAGAVLAGTPAGYWRLGEFDQHCRGCNRHR